jgi:hypothetical protein
MLFYEQGIEIDETGSTLAGLLLLTLMVIWGLWAVVTGIRMYDRRRKHNPRIQKSN